MSTAELMKSYCEGDPDAFRKLYAVAAPPLLCYLRLLARDHSTAEEVLQQTFLKLHGARSIYERGVDPVPWLYAIAHRTFIDEVRRGRRSRVRLLRSAEDSLPELAVTIWGTHSEAARPYSHAECTAVLAALNKLPQGQRAAVMLTKFEGLTMGDAARALGTTEGAVKLRAHRAYARLRKLLSSDDIFDDRLEAAVRSSRSRRRRVGV